jgi:hypothetical protein
LGSYFKETKRNERSEINVIGQTKLKSNVSCGLQSLQTFDATATDDE